MTATRAAPCASESATSSEFVIRVALWAGVVAAALSMLLVVAIYALRGALLIQRRRQQQLLDSWRPRITASALAGAEPGAEPLPVLRSRDVPAFLLLWNHYQGSVRGDAREHLNRLARALGLEGAARRLLRRRRLRHRLLAAVTLGQLGDRAAWDELVTLAASAHPLLSLTAARALVQIDARAAIPLLMPALAARSDWPAARVATILREAGPGIVSPPLVAALTGAGPEAAARVVGLFEFAHAEATTPALRALLEGPATDEHALTVCLRVLRDPQLIGNVRRLVAHPRWHIRMEAAKALGRMGEAEDEARLERLLTDPQWWVRYRAAQALARLPSVDRRELERVRDRQHDRYARDILSQVLAEKTLA